MTSLSSLLSIAQRVTAAYRDLGPMSASDAVELAEFVEELVTMAPTTWLLRRTDGRSIYADGEQYEALQYDTEREARDYLAAWDDGSETDYEIVPVYEVHGEPRACAEVDAARKGGG